MEIHATLKIHTGMKTTTTGEVTTQLNVKVTIHFQDQADGEYTCRHKDKDNTQKKTKMNTYVDFDDKDNGKEVVVMVKLRMRIQKRLRCRMEDEHGDHDECNDAL